ncbi:two-component system, NtrC family, response regulator AtoC [Armatimonadetes bacterium GBS]|jgi:DNA-binding NtrC family response regulator|nr:MAG: acetoacetate metabolism regulatory protein AtoC [Fimbriimonadales bacterium]CUU01626.1 two-component system, NtrC family, response regulator AtoC [Armatimonadetes bacterium GBS]CUU35535.1 two-component system, NtrC family, response regulator AtoC [Armatimonadetes bacterium GXS]
MAKILIVDDEQNIRRVLARAFEKNGYEVSVAENAHQALRLVDEFQPDLVLSDVVMPGPTGLELLKKLRAKYPDLPVVMMTAFGTIPMAVEAIRSGAFEFLTKPLDMDSLFKVVRHALEESRKPQPRAKPKASSVAKTVFIGQSPAVKAVLEIVERVAKTRATVLITGESGTGKELIARMLHEKSDRASGPFVPVSCAAIPETLIEVELFGAVKGAYTGAETDRIGKFEAANGGTLFLDEIGEVPLMVQAKLLRVIQEREIQRLGSNESIPIDVRLITATNRDLEQEVAARNFREDLYYRLNVVHIHLPPLRERPEDIPLLAEYFMKKYAAENGRALERLSPETIALLQRHCWKGNVRELENTIEAAVALAPPDAATLLPEHLPPHFHTTTGK